MDCGEATAAAVDNDGHADLEERILMKRRQKRLLAENRDVLDQIAAF